MSDQADKLRELVHGSSWPVDEAASGPPMIVVAGGKGGVGTTTVAVNLAAVLADREFRVVAVDAARQHADLAQVAGIGPISGGTVADVMAGKCRALDALVPGPAGALLLANCWAPKADPDYSRHAQQRLLAELRTLHGVADVLVVDVGSGLTAWTRRLWAKARLVILVTTTDDVAVMDTYAAIKISLSESVTPDLRILINQCESPETATDVNRRIAAACQRFLGRTVPALPALPLHETRNAASGASAPRVWESPKTHFSHEALWLGHAVDDVLSVGGRRMATTT